MSTRGPYKQYTVNGSGSIPRRTIYRKRKRLLLEVGEQMAIMSRDLDEGEVCI